VELLPDGYKSFAGEFVRQDDELIAIASGLSSLHTHGINGLHEALNVLTHRVHGVHGLGLSPH